MPRTEADRQAEEDLYDFAERVGLIPRKGHVSTLRNGIRAAAKQRMRDYLHRMFKDDAHALLERLQAEEREG
jgi:hypothetical protein